MASQPRKRANQSPRGEQDLALKLAMRRVFWGMNYATRLNVKLAIPGSRRGADELSDLDCVGFSIGGDFSTRMLIADCKSSAKVSPASRLFWVAGVRDFFGADRAYCVLERSIPDGVRGQAGQLGVDVLGPDDRQILENVHAVHAPSAPFFALEGAQQLAGYGTGMDKRLDDLVRFRDHDYWYLPPERRVQQLLAAIRGASKHLDASQRAHAVLLLDLLFLLTLALLSVCRHVSATSLADPRGALLDYLLGGSEFARARRSAMDALGKALDDVGVELPKGSGFEIEPPYFDELAEVVARLLRRPRDAQRLLRYIEWWGQAEVGLEAPTVVDSLGPAYGEITRKLVFDIARFMKNATNLGDDWVLLSGSASIGSQPVRANGGQLQLKDSRSAKS